jgi:hypothetical protein
VIEFGSAIGARGAHARPWRGGRALPRALVMLLLACLLVQGTAIQTHIHFTGQARSAISAAPGDRIVQTAKAGGGSDAADCPLCQEAAMAGVYLLPPAIVIPPPPAPLPWIAAATIG